MKNTDLKNKDYLILDTMEDGFLQADTQGKIIRANRKIASMCGYSHPKDMIGMDISKFYADEDERRSMLEKLEKEKILHNYELEFQNKDKIKFWTLSNIKIIYDEVGNRMGTEGVIRDISKRKEINQSREANEQQLRAANQQLMANEQQLRAANQQLAANDQQLRAANQQLAANEQQLRAANQQLAANEQQLLVILNRYQRAQEIGHVGNWDYNLQTNCFWGSEEAKRIYGFDSGTSYFSAEEIEKCIPERERVHQVLIDMIKHEKPYDIEFEIIKKNTGESRFIHSIAELEKDSRGNPLRVVGSIHDITESKRAREEIETLSKFPSENPFPVLRISKNGDILYFNNPGYELLEKWEYSKQNSLPVELIDFTKETYKTNTIHYRQVNIADKSMSLAFVPIKEKDFVNVYGMDISEIRKAQEQIESLAKFPAENPFPVLRVSLNGDLIYINNAGERILHALEENNESILPHEWKQFAKETFKLKRIRYRDIKVDKKTLSLAYVPVPENDFINVYGLDITDRIEMENMLRDALKKAEESDKLKTAFLANMSHEIRTPMNGIMGFTSLLQKPDLTGEKREKYIKIIQKSGERMLSTVNDLISISKIETGLEEVRYEEVNPCELIKNLYDFFKPSAEEKGLDLILRQNYTLQHEMIKTDATKLNSIVRNLIRNAIKFTETGSITIDCEKESKFMIIKVTDTGSGIAKDRQKAIFDRFIQADIYDSNVHEGSGLGLSIVKAYVQMLKGTINLESEPEKGSCFTITLPLEKIGKAINKPEIKINDIPQFTFNKILIAEDDDISYQHLSISLESYATRILRAKNGDEAIKIAKDNPDIDLILMDIKMPMVDGFMAAEMIRQFNKKVPIICQSAYAMPQDKNKALSVGCNGYISKPIDIDELLSIISISQS